MANIRSAYAGLVTEHLSDGSAHSATVSVQQRIASWTSGNNGTLTVQNGTAQSEYSITAKTSGTYTVTITESGAISVN